MLTRTSAAKEPLRVPDEILSNLRTGDLVFRLGDVTDSRIIATATDFKYSHVGMIVRERPLLVVHAVTGEGGRLFRCASSWRMRETLARCG